MGLFEEFRSLITEATGDVPRPALSDAFERLAAGYGRGGGSTAATSSADVAAYAAGRALATYLSAERVFEETARARPDWRPRSVLDLGAGIGSASWAAAAVFGSIEELTAVELGHPMRRLGTELSSRASNDALRSARWVSADATSPPEGMWDLVVASYVLGEIPAGSRSDAVRRWLDATSDTLVLIDVGSPRGFNGVLGARDVLITSGASVVAPCPHDTACPMRDGDWCHFAVRVPRTRMHRQLKGGVRGFEDEKFSYVVASKSAVTDRCSRIVQRPGVHSGHVRLKLCEPDGLHEVVVSRREGEQYKLARKARWGDRYAATP